LEITPHGPQWQPTPSFPLPYPPHWGYCNSDVVMMQLAQSHLSIPSWRNPDHPTAHDRFRHIFRDHWHAWCDLPLEGEIPSDQRAYVRKTVERMILCRDPNAGYAVRLSSRRSPLRLPRLRLRPSRPLLLQDPLLSLLRQGQRAECARRSLGCRHRPRSLRRAPPSRHPHHRRPPLALLPHPPLAPEAAPQNRSPGRPRAGRRVLPGRAHRHDLHPPHRRPRPLG
jgi:hypothetical protein